MARLHLIEIEDQSWCPAPVRDGGTDFLQFTQKLGNPFASIVPKLAEAIKATGSTKVIDLCSGGAGPWLRTIKELDAAGVHVDVSLTDLRPNARAFAGVEKESGGRIRGVLQSVDATNAPEEVRGFRTIFNGFHHFRPELAKAILKDAIRRREGIAIFEAVERTPQQMLAIPFMALTHFFLVPFMRPFRWSRLFFTYVLPLIPALITFDGLVSCLRVYSPKELEALVNELGETGYTWEVGRVKSLGPSHTTYLIGVPAKR